jgi:hypothetical protein
MRVRLPCFVILLAAALCIASRAAVGQSVAIPTATLSKTTAIKLPGAVDSNSPAVWQLVRGQPQLFVMTSFAGLPSTASGPALVALGSASPVTMDPWPGGGVWMEAVIADVDGTWYGYFHNEIVATACRTSEKVIPSIGAARSVDRGRTWEVLGTILEAPPRSYDCATLNKFFVGGVGDLSVQLSPDSQDLYIFYSEYMRNPSQQGISVARLAWADRDEPTGKVMLWRGRSWMPASRASSMRGGGMLTYVAGAPLFPTTNAWHDDNTSVNAFWGPSVHWNTYLNQYVMLLNRAKDETFAQEGIYISFAPRLDNPELWSTPTKLVNGGRWYPEVIGLERGTGTDKVAGEVARFFMSGTSDWLIQFRR